MVGPACRAEPFAVEWTLQIVATLRSLPAEGTYRTMPVAVPLHEIRAEFAELDDPNDRMTYLVEIGQTLPPLDPHQRVEENRVLGCQSMVWLVANERQGSPRTLEFVADSDAPMVRGLIAILLAAYSGKTAQEIVAFPIEELFAELKLKAFITPMRSNGLYSMVRRVQTLARQALEKDAEQPSGPATLAVVPLMPL